MRRPAVDGSIIVLRLPCMMCTFRDPVCAVSGKDPSFSVSLVVGCQRERDPTAPLAGTRKSFTFYLHAARLLQRQSGARDRRMLDEPRAWYCGGGCFGRILLAVAPRTRVIHFEYRGTADSHSFSRPDGLSRFPWFTVGTPPERYTAGLSCFDTELQSFVRFPRAEAFAKHASHVGGMWHGLRMTGHAAVPCSRGLMFIGGLVPRGHSTMNAWVLDVVGGRRSMAKKRRRRRARGLAGTGGCGQS